MSQNPGYTQGVDHDQDSLVIDGPIVTETITLTDNQGQGAITRGSVIARHTDNTFAKTHQTGNYDPTKVVGILAADADPSGGDVSAILYVSGLFNEDELSFGGTVTLSDIIRQALRDKNVHLRNPVSR